MFEPTLIPADKDGYRTCGTCLNALPVVQFYKDGKDKDGNYKYRRDCKNCYRISRLTERQAKRAPEPKPKGRKRKVNAK